MSPNRVLVATWDGSGNVPPVLGLARRLVERGHAVHVLADPTIEAEATAVGCTFAPWTTAPHASSRRPEDLVIKDWEHTNPLKMMDTYLTSFLGDPAPRWAADVDGQLAAASFDAALVDFALPAAMIPVEARGIPLLGLMPQCWFLPTKGIPPMGMGFGPSSNPLAKVRDAALRRVTTRLFNRALPPLNATRASYGLPPAPSTAAQMLSGRMLVLTSPAFDFTSPHQPANMSYAGPVLDDPSWTEPWQSPWADDDDRPLVVVGLSSGFQDQLAVLERVADALVTLPVRAVVTLGLGLDDGALAPRSGAGDVVVRRTAPHATLLPQASLVVTHCGHGTTMKSLVAGVPMVCLPMGRDQNDNAARIVHHGAGLELKPTASSSAITKAVKTVLGEPRYRAAAAGLGARIAAREGCVDPIVEIETTMRNAATA